MNILLFKYVNIIFCRPLSFAPPGGFHEFVPGTVTSHERPRIGPRMVWGPVLGIEVVLRPFKDRVRDGMAIQVQLVAHVGGWLPVRAAKVGVGQQQPIAFEVVDDDGRFR